MSEDKTAINARVQRRYEELAGEGKHGFYETLFRIVHEERALVGKTDSASASSPSQPQGEQSPAPESPQVNPHMADESPQAAAQSTAQWVMVPKEPTPEMVAAMAVVHATGRETIKGRPTNHTVGMAGAVEAYAEMLAAAPSAQSTALEPVAWLSKEGDSAIPAHEKAAYLVHQWPKFADYIAAKYTTPLYATPSAAMALLGEAREALEYIYEVHGLHSLGIALIARIDALTGIGTGRKEQSNG